MTGAAPEWGGARFVGRLALGFAWVGLVWSQTLPQGAQVLQGAVQVSQSGSQMAITQGSAKAVVNWQSFDIGQNAKVTVSQPGSQSVLLNRVLSDNPTQILGQLQANGQVVLVNPKGIVVGSDGSVSASAFTASTLGISDADFMAGASRYVRDGATGAVVNKGLITTAPGGYVALLGATVQNEGRIVAPQGAVVMGAADAAVLPEALTGSLYMPVGRTGKIKLELTPATVNAWVKNDKSGVIVTEGGQVYMQAAAVHSAVASVFQSGRIDTSAAQAGDVHLLADGGRIVVDGQITANSADAQRPGGDIVIGRDVDTGVLAASTDVSAARLESRRGFVETSAEHLVVDGVQVKAGQWLLDPTDITITTATSGMSSSGTNPITQAPNTSGTTASTVSATTLASSLSAGTSVVVKTTNASGTGNGDITVASNIAVTGATDATLTLQAERDIVVNAGVSIARTGTNKLNVVLNSDVDGSGAGAIVMNTGSSIASNGGNITLGGGSAGDGSGHARGYSALAQGVRLRAATLSAGGGAIAVRGQGFLGTGSDGTADKGHGISLEEATVSTTGAGTLSLTGVGAGTMTGSSGVSIGGGSVTGGSTGTVTVTGTHITNGTSGNYYGVRLFNGGTSDALLTSSGGNVVVEGTGGGSGASNFNYGVRVDGALISAGGMGTVNVTGTGATTSGTLNNGVVLGGSSSSHGITSSGGAVTVTGIAGAPAASSTGLRINSGALASITSGGNANVTLVTDSLALDGGAVSAGTGTVSIKNRTAGTLINVGGASTDTLSGTLQLDVSSAELARITAGTTVIGRNDATGSGLLTVGAMDMGAMGNPGGHLSLLSGGGITVSDNVSKTAGGDANLTLNANGDIAVAAGKTVSSTSNKLNVLLNSDGDGSGAGAIVMNTGSGITSNGGNITLGGGASGDASSYARGHSASPDGVLLNSATLAAGGGNLRIRGQGGASSTASARGVALNTSTVSTTGAGTLNITGYGAASTNTPTDYYLGHNTGVLVNGGSVTGGSTGAVTFYGVGGNASAAYNYGVSVTNSGVVSSTGSSVSVTGLGGGSGASDRNIGVQVSLSGQITSGGGNVGVTGTGKATTGGLNAGVGVVDGGKITATASGNVTVTGTGGGTTNDNFGVWLYGTGTAAPVIESASGNIGITGTAGGTTTSTGRYDITVGGDSRVTSTAGQVTLTADSVNLIDNARVSANTTNGTVTVQNRTAGTLIQVGGSVVDAWAASPQTLALSQAELGKISAATTVVGRNDASGSGMLTVSGAVNMGTMGNPNGHLTLVSGASAAINEGISKTAGTDANLTVKANDDITVAAGKSLSSTSNKLNVVLNSDAEASGSGAIKMNVGSSIVSNGGSIKLGGGTNASTYAVGNSVLADGIFLDGVSLLSTGGNIAMMGKSSAGSNNDGDWANAGIRLRDTSQAVQVNSGAGTIAMDGISQSTYTVANSHGVHIGGYGNSTTIQSSSSAATAIDIKGVGAANNSNVSGVFINNTASVLSTGTGGITLTGEERRPAWDGNQSETGGVFIKAGRVLSASGQISINGISNLNHGIDLNWSGGYVGGRAGTAVPTSSANIVLTSNNMWLGNTSKTAINTTGTVTLKTSTAATGIKFGGLDVTGASGTLGLEQTELDVITANNLVVGSALASNISTSSDITTLATSGNVTLLTSGNIAVDNTLTIGGATASKTLTLNATGTNSTVTDGAAGAIKATNLELLGLTAAYTLDSARNAISKLAGNTGSVTLVDSVGLTVGTVNTINSTNSSTGTVGLTTTGNINLSGTSSASGVHGILVSNAVTATGAGSISLNGSTSNALGVNLASNVSANTGTISITGTSTPNVGVYVGNSQVSSKGAIAINGTGGNIGVNLDGASASVVSLAGGSDFAGADAISITGSGSGGTGVFIRRPVTNNSTNGATTIKSTIGNVNMDQTSGVITNASTAGAINIAAGNGTNTSSAGISAVAGAQIVQNANADVVLTTDGQGNVSSPKIVKNSTGAGDIVLAAGKLLAAGVATGGQVKPVAGNSVTNSGTGSLYVYSGSPTSANTAAMSSLDASLANLYLSAVGANAQNADANVAYDTSGVRNTIAGGPKSQVLLREKVSVGTISGATVAKTYGDANTGSTETAALWTDMTTALKTANATSGVSNVNSTSTTAGTLQVTASAIVDSLAGSLQSTAYSTAQKLKANTSGYTYSAPVSSKYTTALTAGQSAIVTVARKSINLSGITASNKTYDGNDLASVSVTGALFNDKVAGDDLSVSSSGVFSNKNAGENKTVTLTNTLDGTDLGNYAVTDQATATANIAKKDVTLTGITAAGKTYDGNTDATITAGSISGTVGTETLAVSGSGTFDTKNAGTNKTVTVSDVAALTKANGSNGGDWDNYNLTTTGSKTTTANIAKKGVTLESITAANKTYDGSDAATITAGAIGGTVGTETLAISGSGSFDTKNAGTNKTVTVSDVAALTKANGSNGGDWDNYRLTTTGQMTTQADIAKKDVTLTGITAAGKTYDGNTDANITAGSISGTVGTETLAISGSGSFNTKDAGTNKTVTVSDVTSLTKANGSNGGDWDNYSLTTTGQMTTQADIAKKEVTLTGITASNKTYDGNTDATISSGVVSGTVGTETLAVSGSGSFDTKNAGTNKTVTVSDVATLTKANGSNGGDWDNYNLTTTGSKTTTANIAKKDVTLDSLTAANKTYDGSDSATITAGAIGGTVGTETLAISGSGSFDTKNAGTNKTVTVSDVAALTKANGTNGGDWDNYNLTTTGSKTTTANIAKKDVTLDSLTASSKTYDGSDAATITAGAISGTVGTETLAISGSGSFDTKNAGTNKTVTVSDVATLTKANGSNGGDWDNYNLTTTGSKNTTADIAKADLTMVMSGQSKTYDGTTIATLASGAITATGVTVNGVVETATVTQTIGTYNSKDVATASSVSAGLASSDFTADSGTDLSNYNLPTTVTGTGAIAKANLTVALSAQSKTYDGTTSATLASGAITATGVTVNGVTESATVTQTIGTYNSKNVLAATSVSAALASSDFTAASGTDLANYHLPTTVSGTGTITAKSVTYAGLIVSNKTYDQTTNATLTGTAALGTVTAGSSLSHDGKVIASDVVSLTGTAVGTYASKNVAATNNTVTFSGLSLTGGDASNYSLVQQVSSNGAGTITAKSITPAVQANDKTYDASSTATVSAMGSTDVFAGDAVTFSNTGASFADRHVAKDSSGNVVGKTVTVTGLAIAGDDASNYALGSTSATTTAKITPKSLTLAAVTDSKTYDGTTVSTGTVGVTGLQGDDSATVLQSFASKNVMGTGGSTLQVNSGFTINDGNSGNNYSVTTTTASGSIEKANLTVTANADAKFVTQADATGYNGASFSGLVNDETSAVLGGTLSISRNNASTNVAAGTYAGTLVASGLTSGNYNISFSSGDYTIVPANTLLIRTENVSTVYGTAPTYVTTAQYLDGSTNLINTLSQSGSGNSLTFSDGVGGSVSTVLQPFTVASGSTTAAGLSGSAHTKVGSYSILDTSPNITGSNFVGSPVFVGSLTVTPKALTAAMSASDKVYDGTVTASVTGSSSDIISGDQVSFANTSATFNNKNVGTGKAVAISGITIGGDDAGNYTLQNTTASATANVTVKSLTLIAGNVSKTYDGGTSYTTQTSDLTTLSNQLLSGDSVSAATISYANKNAGASNKVVTLDEVTLSDGNNGGNYAVTLAGNNSSTITPKAITLNAGSVSKTYDGGTTYTTQTADLNTLTSQLISGDSVSAATINYANKNVASGTKEVTLDAVTLSDGNSGGNYTVTLAGNTTSTITPKALTATYTASNKVYDATKQAVVTGFSADIVTHDDVTFANTSAVFDTKDVGTSKAVLVSGIAMGGADAGNYVLQNTTANASADVTRKDVTLDSLTAANKTYDGNTNATITSGVISGTVGSETLAVSGAGSFDNKNAGTHKTVTVADVTALTKVDGSGNWSNYRLTSTGSKTTTASIARKDATITGAETHVTYNASTQTQNAAVLSGFMVSDVTAGTVAATGLASGRHAGRYTSDLSATGTDAGNYNVTVSNADLVIGQKSLVLAASSDSKTYDGTTVSKGAVTALALAGSDTVTASQSFVSKDVLGAAGSTLQVNSGYTIHDGNSGNNYNVSTTTATGTVHQANLTVTANADARFVTQADAAGYNGVSYSGWVNGENSTVLGGALRISRTNASSNLAAGTYAGTLVASGLTSGNYKISYNTGDYTIVPANQLLIRTRNASTVYGTAPTYSTTAQYLDNSHVIHTLSQSGSGNSFTFSDGVGGSVSTVLKPYTVASGSTTAAGVSSSGHTVVGNYSILDTNPAIAGSNFVGTPVFVGHLAVTPQQVSATAQGVSKVYDGTTQMGQATLALSGQLAGDRLTVTGTGAFSQKNAGQDLSYAFSNMILQGADHANYVLHGGTSITGNNGQIIPAPLTFSGTQVADKTYDGNTLAGVVAGTLVGLVGDETLLVSSVNGQFDTPSIGKDKSVTVVYGLSNGSRGGLASNYAWAPVTARANINAPLVQALRAPAPLRLADPYSRLTYQGYGGLVGTGAAMGRTPSATSPDVWATCSPQRLEACICEQAQEGALEICYPAETRPDLARMP